MLVSLSGKSCFRNWNYHENLLFIQNIMTTVGNLARARTLLRSWKQTYLEQVCKNFFKRKFHKNASKMRWVEPYVTFPVSDPKTETKHFTVHSKIIVENLKEWERVPRVRRLLCQNAFHVARKHRPKHLRVFYQQIAEPCKCLRKDGKRNVRGKRKKKRKFSFKNFVTKTFLMLLLRSKRES